MLSPGVPPTRPVAAQGSTLAGPEKTSSVLVTPTRYYPTSSPLCVFASAVLSRLALGRHCCALLMLCAAQRTAQRCRVKCCVCKMHQYLTMTGVLHLRGLHCANVTLCPIRHLHHPTRPNFQTPTKTKLPFFRCIRYGQSCQFADCCIRLLLSPDRPNQPPQSARCSARDAIRSDIKPWLPQLCSVMDAGGISRRAPTFYNAHCPSSSQNCRSCLPVPNIVTVTSTLNTIYSLARSRLSIIGSPTSLSY
jgi:hypothetical protein